MSIIDSNVSKLSLKLRKTKNNRPAYALLGTLIAIAVGMLIYYFTFYRMDSETYHQQLSSPEDYPWVDEWRIRGSDMPRPQGQDQASLAPEQPHITESLKLKTRVSEDKKNRGSILIFLEPDGSILGGWSGDYNTQSLNSQIPINHVINFADFEGNIDPAKIYQDEKGEDPSKLFFITKGKLSLLETNMDNNRVRHVMGLIYVVGWISSDFSVAGRVHITSDKKSQRIYQFSGCAKSPEPSGRL